MKKFAMFSALAAILFTSCDTTRMTSTTDDVYASPAEERRLERQAAADKAKEEALARQKAEAEAEAASAKTATVKEKDNEYYRDPEYRADDYYDYEYSSRINRFYNPIGVGYYDNYYTNMYTYNQNPMFYGTSIYSSYGYGMPSQQFSSISIGISSGWGYGYGYGGGWNSCNNYGSMYYPFYDPWCPSYGMYSGWGYNSWGYNNWGYMNGYNNGFYQGYAAGYNNASWNYYNRFDANSGYGQMEYGPRGTNLGGNSRRGTNPGMQVDNGGNAHRTYLENVAAEQNNRPRFTNTGGRRVTNNENQEASPARVTNPNTGRIDNAPVNNDQRSNGSGRNRNSNRVSNREQPVQHETPSRRSSEPVINSTPGNNNNSGGSSPRNSGGGGGGRRR